MDKLKTFPALERALDYIPRLANNLIVLPYGIKNWTSDSRFRCTFPKKRMVNPWVIVETGRVRLSDLSSQFKEDFAQMVDWCTRGYSVYVPELNIFSRNLTDITD